MSIVIASRITQNIHYVPSKTPFRRINKIVGDGDSLQLYFDNEEFNLLLTGLEARCVLEYCSEAVSDVEWLQEEFIAATAAYTAAKKVCPRCHGNGCIVGDDGQQENCDVCDAQGEIIEETDL